MDKFIISTGGRPIRNEDIKLLNDDAVKYFKQFGKMFNKIDRSDGTYHTKILVGCEITGTTTVTEGIIIHPNGELYYHPSTDYSPNDPNNLWWVIDETDSDSRTYKDGNNKYTIKSTIAYLTPSPTSAQLSFLGATIGGTGNTQKYSDTVRISDLLDQVINNKLSFDNGDIYTNSASTSLELQSWWDYRNNPTTINRYGGTLTIGSSSYPDVDTKIYGDLDCVDDSFTTIYSGAFNSGTITISSGSSTRMVYAYSHTSVSNDFDVLFDVGAVRVGRTGAYLGYSFILPAGVVGSITLQTGSAAGFAVLTQKFGNV